MRTLGVRVMIVAVLLLFSGFLVADSAQAHGYPVSPPSRQALCAQGVVAGCGDTIVYTPHGVEAAQGSRQCSGGNPAYALLDDSSRGWPSTPVTSPLTVTWTLTAPHATLGWQYYIGDTLVGSFDDNGAIPATDISHQLDLGGFSGRQTILAVWNIHPDGGNGNAFYACIDVDIAGGSGGSGQAVPQPVARAAAPAPMEAEMPMESQMPMESVAPVPVPAPVARVAAPAASAAPAPIPAPVPVAREAAPEAPVPMPAAVPNPPAALPERAPVVPAPAAPLGEWAPWIWADAGSTVTFHGLSYRCLQAHTTQPDWPPDLAPALWEVE